MDLRRRDLLSWMGSGAALLSPLFRSLRAEAQGAAARPILITLNNYFGYQFRDNLDYPAGDISGVTFQPSLAPIEKSRTSMVIIRNFNYKFNTGLHGPPESVIYTGTRPTAAGKAGGPSFDSYIAQKLGAGDPFPLLALGTPANSPSRSLTFDSAGNQIPSETDIIKTYARVFGSPIAGMAAPGAAMPSLLAEDRSVLDFALQDVKAMSVRLAASERHRLDQFADSLRAYEKQLGALAAVRAGAGTAPASCMKPTAPALGASVGSKSFPGGNELAYHKAVADFMALAVMCGMTSVVSYIMGSVGHNDAHGQNMAAINPQMAIWHEAVQHLVDRLRTFPRGSGTAFDQTYLLQWPNTGGHHANDQHVVMIGGFQGKIKGGRMIVLPGKDHTNNQLMATLARVLGAPTANDKFGDPDVCPSPLAL